MAQPQSLPNLLLAGVPKAATTALARALAASPDIDAGVTKEPGILSNHDYSDGQVRYLYERHFTRRACRFRLDATPWLIYTPEVLHRLAREEGASTRVLVVLREPWSRMESMYLDQVRRRRERRSFETALVEGGDRLSTSYLHTSVYAPHLMPWAASDVVDLRIAFFEDVALRARRDRIRGALAEWLSTGVGPIDVVNQRTDGTPILAGTIDRAVRLGTRAPARARARVRPPLARLARLMLSWSPRRAPTDDLLVTLDADLRKEVDQRFEQDAVELRLLLRPEILLLPELPDWLRLSRLPPNRL